MKSSQQMLPLTMGNGVPVEKTADAEDFYARLPKKATARVLQAVDEWLKETPAQRIKVEVFTDPEDEDWRELLVKVLVDPAGGAYFDLWEDVGAVLDSAFADLSPADAGILNDCFAVHIVPEDSCLDVES